MGAICHFFGEDVAGIDFSGNMADFRISALVRFTDFVFAKVYVLGTLVGKGSSPINAGLVVIVNGPALRGPPERQMRKPEKERYLKSLRGVPVGMESCQLGFPTGIGEFSELMAFRR